MLLRSVFSALLPVTFMAIFALVTIFCGVLRPLTSLSKASLVFSVSSLIAFMR
jgi:hypothetical protein